MATATNGNNKKHQEQPTPTSYYNQLDLSHCNNKSTNNLHRQARPTRLAMTVTAEEEEDATDEDAPRTEDTKWILLVENNKNKLTMMMADLPLFESVVAW
jgi:hypothetical protein